MCVNDYNGRDCKIVWVKVNGNMVAKLYDVDRECIDYSLCYHGCENFYSGGCEWAGVMNYLYGTYGVKSAVFECPDYQSSK